MTTETAPANRFQKQFGVPYEVARTKVQDYIRETTFVVLASSDDDENRESA